MGKYTVLRTYTKSHQLKFFMLFYTRPNFLLFSFICIHLYFVCNLLSWSKPRYLKAEAHQVPQKIQNVQVRYLLLGICILVAFMNMLEYLKKLVVLRRQQIIIFMGAFKIRKEVRVSMTTVIFCQRKIYFFSGNENLTSNN